MKQNKYTIQNGAGQQQQLRRNVIESARDFENESPRIILLRMAVALIEVLFLFVCFFF